VAGGGRTDVATVKQEEAAQELSQTHLVGTTNVYLKLWRASIDSPY
jgi:hypothetical protein